MANRRTFLKQMAAGTSAVALAPSFTFSTKRAKDKLGVALVGLGYYSTDVLAPALQLTEHCELKGIVTGSPEKIPVWQEKYGIEDKNVYNYENMHTVADNSDIDVIYIVLPPSMHCEYSIKAAEAGKHVWCEKPMALTVEECQRMIDAAQRNNVKLSIGYRLQHEPNTQQLIEFSKEKTYGAIRMVTASAGYYDGRSNHWKQKKEMGGGAMYDMGVYPLNAIRYATQEEPISVMAQQFTNRPEVYTEVDETMLFQLEFPSGAVANGATSFGMSMNYLYVTCSEGWYKLEPFQSYSGVQGVTSRGVQLDERIPNQQAKQMDDDALAIKNDTPVIVPGEEGLKDIRVVEKVYESVKYGCPVDIKQP